jgi:N-acetylglucosaminyldiphosphoundecaprenol N-acetyl-beta-D-mannosaminyltransferase
VVDFNVLSNVFWDLNYKKIILNSSFNTCDGSLIAFLLNMKHKKSEFQSYNGPEIFKAYIENPEVEHLIIGGSSKSFIKLKSMVDVNKNLNHLQLPFLNHNQFNYDEIANYINERKPHLIWVMLGCPKQELFINNIYGKINQGLLIGSGAAMNFYIGELKNQEFSLFGLRFIWLSRLISEPVKQSKRIFKFLLIFPKILTKL